MAKSKIILVLAHIENYKWVETEMVVKSIEKAMEFGRRKLWDNNTPFCFFYIVENGVVVSKDYLRATFEDLPYIIADTSSVVINREIYKHPKLAIVKGGFVVLPPEGTQILFG